jgi:hypothetical protein
MNDNKVKRNGENKAGIEIQMRFVPAERPESKKDQKTTISVKIYDEQKGSPDK